MSDCCKRCKRPLRDPESVQRGYGAICWVKTFPDQAVKVRKRRTAEEDPNQMKLFSEEETNGQTDKR